MEVQIVARHNTSTTQQTRIYGNQPALMIPTYVFDFTIEQIDGLQDIDAVICNIIY